MRWPNDPGNDGLEMFDMGEQYAAVLITEYSEQDGFGKSYLCPYVGADWQEDIEQSTDSFCAEDARHIDAIAGRVLADSGYYDLCLVEVVTDEENE